MLKRKVLVLNGDTFAENKEYRICRFHREDKEYFEALWAEIPIKSTVDEEVDKKVMEQSWRHMFEDEDMCKYKIVEKATSSFVGSIEIRELDEEAPELGIQLLEKYHRKGIGTNMMSLFLAKLDTLLPGIEYTMKIRSNNEASKRMAQKLGAVEYRTEGMERAEFYRKVVEKMGREQFEAVTGTDFESTQQYIVCYKVTP